MSGSISESPLNFVIMRFKRICLVFQFSFEMVVKYHFHGNAACFMCLHLSDFCAMFSFVASQFSSSPF